jgi:DNA repair protein RadC
MKHGLAGFADYEVLELLLTLAIPRSDVKQPAKTLMARFGNLRGILDAPLEALQAVEGIGAVTPVALRIIRGGGEPLPATGGRAV